MHNEPTRLTAEQIAALAALADGIIPPDEVDAGARSVEAGPRLAVKIDSGVNTALYRAGLGAAEGIAQRTFRNSVTMLGADALHVLIGHLREEAPAFFKQLRMDVAALYLSDPAVWKRIGFPGPSIALGGHPDFDQVQPK